MEEGSQHRVQLEWKLDASHARPSARCFSEHQDQPPDNLCVLRHLSNLGRRTDHYVVDEPGACLWRANGGLCWLLVHPPGIERQKRIIMLFYSHNFLGAAK